MEFLTTGFTQFIILIIGLSTGIAVVSAAVCLVKIMAADDPKQVSEGKSGLKDIAIAWVILNTFWVLIGTIFDMIDTINY